MPRRGKAKKRRRPPSPPGVRFVREETPPKLYVNRSARQSTSDLEKSLSISPGTARVVVRRVGSPNEAEVRPNILIASSSASSSRPDRDVVQDQTENLRVSSSGSIRVPVPPKTSKKKTPAPVLIPNPGKAPEIFDVDMSEEEVVEDNEFLRRRGNPIPPSSTSSFVLENLEQITSIGSGGSGMTTSNNQPEVLEGFKTFKCPISVMEILLQEQQVITDENNPPPKCCVQLICSDGYLYIHKFLLAAWSPNFLRIILAEDKSSTPSIVLPDYKISLVAKFLICIYSGYTIIKSMEEIMEAQGLFKILQINNLGAVEFAKPQEIKEKKTLRFYEEVEDQGQVHDQVHNQGSDHQSSPVPPTLIVETSTSSASTVPQAGCSNSTSTASGESPDLTDILSRKMSMYSCRGFKPARKERSMKTAPLPLSTQSLMSSTSTKPEPIPCSSSSSRIESIGTSASTSSSSSSGATEDILLAKMPYYTRPFKAARKTCIGQRISQTITEVTVESSTVRNGGVGTPSTSTSLVNVEPPPSKKKKTLKGQAQSMSSDPVEMARRQSSENEYLTVPEEVRKRGRPFGCSTKRNSNEFPANEERRFSPRRRTRMSRFADMEFPEPPKVSRQRTTRNSNMEVDRPGDDDIDEVHELSGNQKDSDSNSSSDLDNSVVPTRGVGVVMVPLPQSVIKSYTTRSSEVSSDSESEVEVLTETRSSTSTTNQTMKRPGPKSRTLIGANTSVKKPGPKSRTVSSSMLKVRACPGPGPASKTGKKKLEGSGEENDSSESHPIPETCDLHIHIKSLLKCGVCKKTFEKVNDATKCLYSHGFQRCWICLEMIPADKSDGKKLIYKKHCLKKGHGCGGDNEKIDCPICESKIRLDFIESHIKACHLPGHGLLTNAKFTIPPIQGDVKNEISGEVEQQNENQNEEQEPQPPALDLDVQMGEPPIQIIEDGTPTIPIGILRLPGAPPKPNKTIRWEPEARVYTYKEVRVCKKTKGGGTNSVSGQGQGQSQNQGPVPIRRSTRFSNHIAEAFAGTTPTETLTQECRSRGEVPSTNDNQPSSAGTGIRDSGQVKPAFRPGRSAPPMEMNVQGSEIPISGTTTGEQAKSIIQPSRFNVTSALPNPNQQQDFEIGMSSTPPDSVQLGLGNVHAWLTTSVTNAPPSQQNQGQNRHELQRGPLIQEPLNLTRVQPFSRTPLNLFGDETTIVTGPHRTPISSGSIYQRNTRPMPTNPLLLLPSSVRSLPIGTPTFQFPPLLNRVSPSLGYMDFNLNLNLQRQRMSTVTVTSESSSSWSCSSQPPPPPPEVPRNVFGYGNARIETATTTTMTGPIRVQDPRSILIQNVNTNPRPVMAPIRIGGPYRDQVRQILQRSILKYIRPKLPPKSQGQGMGYQNGSVAPATSSAKVTPDLVVATDGPVEVAVEVEQPPPVVAETDSMVVPSPVNEVEMSFVEDLNPETTSMGPTLDNGEKSAPPETVTVEVTEVTPTVMTEVPNGGEEMAMASTVEMEIEIESDDVANSSFVTALDDSHQEEEVLDQEPMDALTVAEVTIESTPAGAELETDENDMDVEENGGQSALGQLSETVTMTVTSGGQSLEEEDGGGINDGDDSGDSGQGEESEEQESSDHPENNELGGREEQVGIPDQETPILTPSGNMDTVNNEAGLNDNYDAILPVVASPQENNHDNDNEVSRPLEGVDEIAPDSSQISEESQQKSLGDPPNPVSVTSIEGMENLFEEIDQMADLDDDAFGQLDDLGIVPPSVPTSSKIKEEIKQEKLDTVLNEPFRKRKFDEREAVYLVKDQRHQDSPRHFLGDQDKLIKADPEPGNADAVPPLGSSDTPPASPENPPPPPDDMANGGGNVESPSSTTSTSQEPQLETESQEIPQEEVEEKVLPALEHRPCLSGEGSPLFICNICELSFLQQENFANHICDEEIDVDSSD